MAKLNKIGILSNPLSGRVKNDVTAIQDLSKSIPEGIYREASNQAEFKTVLEEFSNNKIEVLVIIGGDGTIHAVLSYLFSRKIFSSLPMLAIVPAGTTNMTAKDFKISGKPTISFLYAVWNIELCFLPKNEGIPVNIEYREPLVQLLPIFCSMS